MKIRRVCLISLLCSPLLANNVDIPLDSPIYYEIERLEALGALPNFITLTKPYNTKEIADVLKAIDDPKFESKKRELLRELKRYKKSSFVDTKISLYQSNEEQKLTNHEGLGLKDGTSMEASARIQQVGRTFSFVATPLFRESLEDSDLMLGDTYGRLGWKNLNLTVGRESLWMGPGQNGTLLFSNNAKPADIVRLSNILPFKFNPSRFETISNLIGYIDVDIFLGRLGTHERILQEDYSIASGHPKILGMQLSFKPLSNFEWGLYRTAMFGGGSRSEDLSTIGDVIFPIGDKENTGSPKEPGDQKAGIFASFNLPNDTQPFKIYLEAAGEDAANITPYKWSFIGGVKLIDFAKIAGLTINYEYLKMDNCNCWYAHHIYQDGYTNDDYIIGHYHGGMGSSHFVGLNYQPDLDRTFLFNYTHEDSGYYQTDRFLLSCRQRVSEKLELELTLAQKEIDATKTATDAMFRARVLYW